MLIPTLNFVDRAFAAETRRSAGFSPLHRPQWHATIEIVRGGPEVRGVKRAKARAPLGESCGGALLWLLLLLANIAVFPTWSAPVVFTVVNQKTAQPMPGRLHVQNAAGQPQRAGALPFWRDHIVCDGTARFELPAGEYRYEAERGPEFTAAKGRFTVSETQGTNVEVRLDQITDLASEGWWSGETHVHRPLSEVELLMEAEDLHVGEVISWWNRVNPWTNTPAASNLSVRFDQNRFYHPLGGEDERDGGALLYFNLDKPIEITHGERHFPSSLVYAEQARRNQGTWIDIEKPFWWDVPLWVAHGIGHTIGIANNHQNRGGMLDNEAWGRPRDRSIYASPHGNGLWTQQIYYHLLNCGIRLPPSAGSASGVLPNPVGYNRVYVHLDGELTYEKWCEQLRTGRSFVSNGPLLRCRANGQWPGHTFTAKGPLQVQVEGRLDSRDPIAALELVSNGRVERLTLPGNFTIPESGWFLVRALAAVTNTFRFASTAPWYVEIAGQPQRPQRAAAEFFVGWCRERMTTLEALKEIGPAQRNAVLQPWQQALTFWENKASAAGTPVTGEIVDATSGQPLAARLYVQGQEGRWLFAESGSANGTAFRYDRQHGQNPRAVEKYTTLSAHPFRLELAPGTYRFLVERGKEYFPLTNEVNVGREPVRLRLGLRRWVNLAARGWFSGDTHVHRDPAELRNGLQAEDVNVVLPMGYWTTADDVPPSRSSRNLKGDLSPAPIQIDDTHVIYPRNTEYEIFTTAKRQHTLGALLVLNHRSVLDLPAVPVRPVAEKARAEGGLLDLEKHNWDWSMALVPIVKPDFYELANNHHWRTEYGITNWAIAAPAWMNIGGGRGSDREWTLYGFQNYYALLNCGFRLRPSAGTAHGVHPVPLGFGRVYVHLEGPFSYPAWMEGLKAGRSFVTTGPMLLATFDQADPGRRFEMSSAKSHRVRVEGTVISERPVTAVEVVRDGQVVTTIRLRPQRTPEGAFTASFRERVSVAGTSWLAARCWDERPDTQARFAHTAPVFFDVPGTPPRPRRVEVEFLIERVRKEIARSKDLLPPEAQAEYEEALRAYEEIGKSAR